MSFRNLSIAINPSKSSITTIFCSHILFFIQYMYRYTNQKSLTTVRYYTEITINFYPVWIFVRPLLKYDPVIDLSWKLPKYLSIACSFSSLSLSGNWLRHGLLRCWVAIATRLLGNGWVDIYSLDGVVYLCIAAPSSGVLLTIYRYVLLFNKNKHSAETVALFFFGGFSLFES